MSSSEAQGVQVRCVRGGGGITYAPTSIVTPFANFPKNTNGSASSTMGGMKYFRKHIYQTSPASAQAKTQRL